MRTIILSDVTDITKVIAALQAAADRVLNAQSLRSLMGDAFNHQDYQYVHPGNGQPAVAGVSILVGGPGEHRDSTALFVRIKQPGGYNRQPASAYVPLRIIQGLRVRLDDSSHLGRPFELDTVNHEAIVMLTLPTQTFVRCPRARIETV